jgi:cell division protein FtsL
MGTVNKVENQDAKQEHNDAVSPVVKPVVKPVDESTRETDKQEYLNARARVKTFTKIIVVIVIIAVIAVIVGIGSCSANSAMKDAANSSDPAKAKVTKSSTSFEDEYYDDVKTLLEKDGFTNVELRPMGDLITGVLHKEGEVESVSIDGNTSFTSGTYFDKNAKVVIAYHSYPEKTANTNASANTANASAATTNASSTAENTSSANTSSSAS